MHSFTTGKTNLHRFNYWVRLCNLWLVFFLPSSLPGQTTEINLHSTWEFRKSGDTTGWMPATVPGCVHTDLMANNIIPDPFYGDNENQLKWVEESDWEYRSTFFVKRKLITRDFVELNFEGLDTYADVYLNDSLILHADNMFRQWNVDVKKFLKAGNNTLYISFHSAVNKGRELMNNYPLQLPGEERVFTRKAQYQYGWDWAPRFVTCGIWKPVELHAWDNGRINSLFVQTIYANPDSAKFFVEYDYELKEPEKIKLRFTNRTTGQVIKTKYKSEANYEGRIYDTIQKPKLWWCAGMGDQNLYTFELKISKGCRTLDKKIITAGIRTIELINNQDTDGINFYFKLNDRPVFAKGANFVPMSSFPSSNNKENYRQLLNETKSMNMNLIRVWGGGIYEDDYFYHLCDSLGIMVWQDFMFACALYPLNELNYGNHISDEIVQQVKRLRTHPCIALWCGNNEILEGWENWGWQKDFNYSEDQKYRIYSNYSDWFDINIPTELKLNLYFEVNYHSTSPSFGFGHPESLSQGDCHYWGVWWGHEPFEIYNQKIPRFMSEYGFQGMPSLLSFQQFIPERDLKGTVEEILSRPTVRNHQKHPTGYETIHEYMERDYQIPKNFDDYIYVSQLLQARGMAIAIEAHRRNMPYCMGTIYWQLNDCWPVTSWSVMDYYGSRKAAFYTIREKYKDVILSTISEHDSLWVYAVNDKSAALNCKLVVRLFATSGENISVNTKDLLLQPQTSAQVFAIPADDFMKDHDSSRIFLYTYLISSDTILADNFFYFTNPKNLDLADPKMSMVVLFKEKKIVLSSFNLIKNLYLYTDAGELKLSDNYFDLVPGIEKVIRFEGDLPTSPTTPVKFKSLNTIYGN